MPYCSPKRSKSVALMTAALLQIIRPRKKANLIGLMQLSNSMLPRARVCVCRVWAVLCHHRTSAASSSITTCVLGWPKTLHTRAVAGINVWAKGMESFPQKRQKHPASEAPPDASFMRWWWPGQWCRSRSTFGGTGFTEWSGRRCGGLAKL